MDECTTFWKVSDELCELTLGRLWNMVLHSGAEEQGFIEENHYELQEMLNRPQDYMRMKKFLVYFFFIFCFCLLNVKNAQEFWDFRGENYKIIQRHRFWKVWNINIMHYEITGFSEEYWILESFS